MSLLVIFRGLLVVSGWLAVIVGWEETYLAGQCAPEAWIRVVVHQALRIARFGGFAPLNFQATLGPFATTFQAKEAGDEVQPLKRAAVNHIKPLLSDQAWQGLRRLGGGATRPAPTPSSDPQSTPARMDVESLSRAELIDALGKAPREGPAPEQSLPRGFKWADPDPFVQYPRPKATRHSMLSGLHERLAPRTYFEIGVNDGSSLALSRTRTIAVDPAYRITAPIRCDLRTFLETSDAFFTLNDSFEHFAGTPVDFAFIDGMHLAEYALRDFMNIEKHMSPGGVVILDDMLPRNSLEAYRLRRTAPWTGDVFKVHTVLREHRPDLTLVPLNVEPTGSYLVVGLDPSSTVLDEAYESLMPFLTSPDPQVVDEAWLDRRTAVDPTALLDCGIWPELVALRNSGAEPSAFAPLWKHIAELPTIGA